MTAPEPPPTRKYALREGDYARAMPGFLSAMDLGQVNEKGLLYMIYREIRAIRIMMLIAFVASALVGLLYLALIVQAVL
jgi:hypothetical protein